MPTSGTQLSSAVSLAWAAIWRAHVAHIALFVIAPGVVSLGKLVLAIVFIPFFLIGEGEVNSNLGSEVSHLVNPKCWLALASCAAAERSVPGLPHRAESLSAAEVAPNSMPEIEPFMEFPSSLTWRHVWFGAWLVWFLLYLIHRERTKTRT